MISIEIGPPIEDWSVDTDAFSYVWCSACDAALTVIANGDAKCPCCGTMLELEPEHSTRATVPANRGGA